MIVGRAGARHFPGHGGVVSIKRSQRNRSKQMHANYTAIVQQRGEWWIGWIEEAPGVNSQAPTRDELLDDLRSALDEALEMNRADAIAAAEGSPCEEVRLSIAA